MEIRRLSSLKFQRNLAASSLKRCLKQPSHFHSRVNYIGLIVYGHATIIADSFQQVNPKMGWWPQLSVHRALYGVFVNIFVWREHEKYNPSISSAFLWQVPMGLLDFTIYISLSLSLSVNIHSYVYKYIYICIETLVSSDICVFLFCSACMWI